MASAASDDAELARQLEDLREQQRGPVAAYEVKKLR
jgi:hypothetical protein